MSVYLKLMKARIRLQSTPLKKSGQNKFAGYSYFELSDFLPTIQQIFHDIGLCGYITYYQDNAQLVIVDTDQPDGVHIVINSPMAEANLKGTHPIQNLGAVETYQRRYLWMTAMEIVENDILEASTNPNEEIKKPSVKEPPKVEVKPPKVVEGEEGRFQIKVTTQGNIDNQAWLSLVDEACVVCLELCNSYEDVMAVFRKNKQLLDKVKAMDPEFFKGLMGKFTVFKNKFKVEA